MTLEEFRALRQRRLSPSERLVKEREHARILRVAEIYTYGMRVLFPSLVHHAEGRGNEWRGRRQ